MAVHDHHVGFAAMIVLDESSIQLWHMAATQETRDASNDWFLLHFAPTTRTIQNSCIEKDMGDGIRLLFDADSNRVRMVKIARSCLLDEGNRHESQHRINIEPRYDPSVDAMYLRFCDRANVVARTISFRDYLMIDLDDHGLIVGLEVISMSMFLHLPSESARRSPRPIEPAATTANETVL